MTFPPIRRWIEDSGREGTNCDGVLYWIPICIHERGKNPKVLILLKCYMATSTLVSFSLIFHHCFSYLWLHFARTFSYTMRQSKDSLLLYNTSLHTLSLRFIAEYTYIYLHINTVDTTGRGGGGEMATWFQCSSQSCAGQPDRRTATSRCT